MRRRPYLGLLAAAFWMAGAFDGVPASAAGVSERGTGAVAEPLRSLRPAAWADLPGFAEGDHRQAFSVLRAWCIARAAGDRIVRPTALATAIPMDGVCASARRLSDQLAPRPAREFFESHFQPWRLAPPGGRGFLTGYYEPEVDGSPVRTNDFRAPILARPDDLVSFTPDEKFFPDERFGVDTPLSAARRRPDGHLEPYPARAAIEAAALQGDVIKVDAAAGHARPLVWLRDNVEVFFIHVQGSARVRLPDGSRLRLAYDGRNGHPYTSIGRILAEEGRMSKADMTLASLKEWLRTHGADADAIMARNRSYIFFKRLPDAAAAVGPLGGAGVALTPLRAIAVDRQIWPYGLPFWIDAALPWRSHDVEPFRRLMIGLDTGSAILGPARADIFFGSGPAAGERAGDIRHPATVFVLLPKDFRPS